MWDEMTRSEMIIAGYNPDEEAEAAELKKKKEETKIYSVFNNRNQFVREYTPEIHGDKRKALAEQFAKKINGKVVIK